MLAVRRAGRLDDGAAAAVRGHRHGAATSGLDHPSIAPYGAYAAGDGELVVIAIQNQREWRRLCANVLGDAAMADDARFAVNEARVANRGALDDTIAAVFGGLSRAALLDRHVAADIAYGAVNSVADLAHHPQLRRMTVASPGGPLAMVAPPARFDDAAPTSRPVPALGEHDAAIRAEFAA